MVKQSLTIEEADDTGLMMMFEDFYLQISFSELHPLMVIYLVRYLERKISIHDKDKVNKLNLASVLGGHTVDTDIGCYAYRTTHWLDAPLTRERFFEILYRSLSEAQRGYSTIQTCGSS